MKRNEALFVTPGKLTLEISFGNYLELERDGDSRGFLAWRRDLEPWPFRSKPNLFVVFLNEMQRGTLDR
jgi:hypothetical protein